MSTNLLWILIRLYACQVDIKQLVVFEPLLNHAENYKAQVINSVS